MVTLSINGATVQARAGATVLEAARQNGISIPTLCHHDSLADIGACRVCVVEAQPRGGRAAILTSCTLPVSEGLEVQTHSERALRTRRLMVEMLLGRAPNAKVLQQLASEVGIDHSRFPVQDTGDCLLCGRCVRVCHDRTGVATTTFAGRGRERHVAAPFEGTSDVCLGCGACTQLCPTGALRLEDQGQVRRVVLRGKTLREVTLVSCASCHAPFAAEPWLRHVREAVSDTQAWEDLCPSCARTKQARAKAPLRSGTGRDA